MLAVLKKVRGGEGQWGQAGKGHRVKGEPVVEVGQAQANEADVKAASWVPTPTSQKEEGRGRVGSCGC